MTFAKGDTRINRNGRPLIIDVEKPTNKSLRNKAFLQLLRKFAPLQTQAVQVAVKIMNNDESSETGKLKSAALIIQTYKELLNMAYDHRYDSDDAEEIQPEHKPQVFSLHMLKPDKPLEG